MALSENLCGCGGLGMLMDKQDNRGLGTIALHCPWLSLHAHLACLENIFYCVAVVFGVWTLAVNVAYSFSCYTDEYLRCLAIFQYRYLTPEF